jgi:Fe2+ transport system protein B
MKDLYTGLISGSGGVGAILAVSDVTDLVRLIYLIVQLLMILLPVILKLFKTKGDYNQDGKIDEEDIDEIKNDIKKGDE